MNDVDLEVRPGTPAALQRQKLNSSQRRLSMRWQQYFVAVATIICNADFFASVLEYTIVAPLMVVTPIEGPACLFQPVGALVPPELYRTFGIASQNLAGTFSSTSSIFIDDGPSLDFIEQKLEFDLLWSAISRACPPYVFTNNNNGNMVLLENYVRTGGCLKTVFFSNFGAYDTSVARNSKDGIVKVLFVNEARQKLPFNDPSLDIVYYVALGRFDLPPEAQRKLAADGRRWTIREKFVLNQRKNGLKYMVFEDVLNLKKKLMFSFIEPVSNSVEESEVMVNPRSEEDYMMLLKTICAKSEGFDDCNMENVLEFYKGDYDQVNQLFLSTKYYRSAHLTKRQNCERKCNATSLSTSFSDDPNRRLLCLCT